MDWVYFYATSLTSQATLRRTAISLKSTFFSLYTGQPREGNHHVVKSLVSATQSSVISSCQWLSLRTCGAVLKLDVGRLLAQSGGKLDNAEIDENEIADLRMAEFLKMIGKFPSGIIFHRCP
jgi:hypothetical protein